MFLFSVVEPQVAANSTTVYLASMTGPCQAGSRGRLRWRGQLDIFRFTTRGLIRRRRGGSRTAAISANTWPRRRAQALGGKGWGPGERDAVRIRRRPYGRVVQGLADGIVGQGIAISLLLHALGRFAAQHHPPTAGWVLNSSKICSIAQRS